MTTILFLFVKQNRINVNFKSLYTYLLLAGIVHTSIFIFHKFTTNVRKLSFYQKLYDQLAFKNSLDSATINNFILFDSWRIKFENYHIDKTITVEDEDENHILLKDLLKNKYNLIFRFTEINCNTCVDEEFRKINNYFIHKKTENIILLSTYNSISDLKKFKKLSQIPFKIYN